MFPRVNLPLARVLACWLLVFSLAGEVGAADPAPAQAPVPDRLADQVDEKPPEKDNWIANNLVLFLLLVHGSWITLLVGGLLIARRVVRRREEKRTNQLRTAAGELELPFHDTGDEALEERLSILPLFNTGRGRTLTNLIVADTPELQISLFDLLYVTGRGKNKRVRRQSVVAVQSAELGLPEFHLRPEKTLDAIGSLLGLQDIDFDHHPDFSRAFVLKSKSEQETRDLFDQDLLDFFASRPEFSFEASRGMFVCFRRWKRVEPPEIRDLLGEGLQTMQALRDRLTRG